MVRPTTNGLVFPRKKRTQESFCICFIVSDFNAAGTILFVFLGEPASKNEPINGVRVQVRTPPAPVWAKLNSVDLSLTSQTESCLHISECFLLSYETVLFTNISSCDCPSVWRRKGMLLELQEGELCPPLSPTTIHRSFFSPPLQVWLFWLLEERHTHQRRVISY